MLTAVSICRFKTRVSLHPVPLQWLLLLVKAFYIHVLLLSTFHWHVPLLLLPILLLSLPITACYYVPLLQWPSNGAHHISLLLLMSTSHCHVPLLLLLSSSLSHVSPLWLPGTSHWHVPQLLFLSSTSYSHVLHLLFPRAFFK